MWKVIVFDSSYTPPGSVIKVGTMFVFWVHTWRMNQIVRNRKSIESIEVIWVGEEN